MPEFDRPDAESPFLSFVASEYHRRGTARRLELSKKETSHPFVAGLGLRVPARLKLLDSLQLALFESLPDRFVLKYAKGWSARGVMPLERVAPDRYFDHLALRMRCAEEIIRIQEEVAATFGGDPVWLVEEFVQSTVPVGQVPFDYKMYSFNGAVGLIGQFDRNASPTKMQLFDGRFRPLRHGRDYVIRSKNLQPGLPVIPLHAPEMLWWAQHLSKQADSPFVSVDMYDSPDGPVFGEFTYSPGGVHKRMFVLSHEIIDKLDVLFSGGRPACPLKHASLDERRNLPKPSSPEFRALAGYFYNGGPRGALRLAEQYRGYATQAVTAGEKIWLQRLSGTWQGIAEGTASRIRAAARTVRRSVGVPDPTISHAQDTKQRCRFDETEAG